MKRKSDPFSVGIIMLNTNFPRILGDIGNPLSFDFDIIYERVISARVSAIVTEKGVSHAIKKDIFDGIKRLEKKGVDLIVTTCGFLGEIQDELKLHTNTPMITSALLTIPFARTFLNNSTDKIGVLTFDANKLNEKHFGGHYANDIVIGDISKNAFLYKTIKEDLTNLNIEKAEEEVVSAALQLIAKNNHIKVIILECTNLSPYINTIKSSTNLPVFDLIQAINWFKQTKTV